MGGSWLYPSLRLLWSPDDNPSCWPDEVPTSLPAPRQQGQQTHNRGPLMAPPGPRLSLGSERPDLGNQGQEPWAITEAPQEEPGGAQAGGLWLSGTGSSKANQTSAGCPSSDWTLPVCKPHLPPILQAQNHNIGVLPPQPLPGGAEGRQWPSPGQRGELQAFNKGGKKHTRTHAQCTYKPRHGNTTPPHTHPCIMHTHTLSWGGNSTPHTHIHAGIMYTWAPLWESYYTHAWHQQTPNARPGTA